MVSSIASRLNRLDRQLSAADRAELNDLASGTDVGAIASELIMAVDIDAAYEAAEVEYGTEPTDEQVEAARAERIEAAVRALAANPKLRTRILEVRSSYEQHIDTVTTDRITEAGFSRDAKARALKTITDWKIYIEEHRDELTALQVLYSKPAESGSPSPRCVELANAINRPPYRWTPERLWDAYETLEKSRVRGRGGRVLTDLVSLVRFTIEDESELVPWSDTINERFEDWLTTQEAHGVTFTEDQKTVVVLIKDRSPAASR